MCKIYNVFINGIDIARSSTPVLAYTNILPGKQSFYCFWYVFITYYYHTIQKILQKHSTKYLNHPKINIHATTTNHEA